MSFFNSWNPSDNYMCSKLCYLEETEIAIAQPESYQKRSEIGEDTSSHNKNIAFYLAPFSNSKYFVWIESLGKFSPFSINSIHNKNSTVKQFTCERDNLSVQNPRI